MKAKLTALLTTSILCILLLCAFTFDKNASIKTLTNPYITTYDCTFARLGNEDLLEKYEYLKITFLDNKELEVSFKRIKGKRHAYKCDYTYDDNTGTFEAEIGILGFKFRKSAQIINGKFTLSMPILGKPLIMNFSA